MISFEWLLKAARSPVESISFVISTGLLFYALYLVSPAYEGGYGTVMAESLQRGTEYGLGVFFILCSLPGILSVFIPPLKRQRMIKTGTFGLFLSFLFLTALRIAVFGWIPMSWIPLLLLSLTCGILRLYLEVRLD